MYNIQTHINQSVAVTRLQIKHTVTLTGHNLAQAMVLSIF